MSVEEEDARGVGDHYRATNAALVIYWFAVALRGVFDALRQRERAVVWGVFTLIGNIAALLIYLLSRSRNGEEPAR